MNNPIFSGNHKELGEEVETMARDCGVNVASLLRIGAARLLAEYQRTGSLTLGAGYMATQSPEVAEPPRSRASKVHPLFGDTRPRARRKRAA